MTRPIHPDLAMFKQYYTELNRLRRTEPTLTRDERLKIMAELRRVEDVIHRLTRPIQPTLTDPSVPI